MLKRFLILAACLWSTLAFGQSNIIIGAPPFSGTAITATGYSMANSTLFALPAVSLQQPLPFSIAFGIKSTALGAAVQTVLDTRAGVSTLAKGLYIINSTVLNNAFAFQISINETPTFDCSQKASNCIRDKQINDGNWHDVCWTATAQGTTLYVDGIYTYTNTATTTFVPQTLYWKLGNTSGSNQLISLRDMGYWNRALSPSECAFKSNRALAGFDMNSGSLTTGLVSRWKFGDCTGSGATTACPDSIGSNNLITDQGTPVVTITAPPPGTVSGAAVSLTATCTDAVGVTSVAYKLDGYQIGSSAAGSTYPVTWDSTKVVDATYSLTATCTNLGGVVGTSSPVSITTSNSVTTQTYFFSPTGSDSNNCLTTGTACQTFAKATSFIYHGGDTISFDNAHGTFPQVADALELHGPLPELGSQNYFPSGSNHILTVTSYGGGTCAPIAGTTSGCSHWVTSAAAPITQSLILENVSYVDVKNIWMTGTNTIGSATTGNILNTDGIMWQTDNSNVAAGNTIENMLIEDFNVLIYMPSISGSNPDFVIKNNLLQGTTAAMPIDDAINPRFVSNLGGIIENNLILNLGGHTNAAGNYFTGCCGNGIVPSDGGGGIVAQFNVIHDYGGNNNACGGPAAYFSFNRNGDTYQFNEGYLGQHTGGTYTSGCDWDNYDLDGGVNHSKVLYNYSHSSWGTGFGGFTSNIDVPNSWCCNLYAFNISENDNFPTHFQQGSVFFGSETLTTANTAVVNNTVINKSSVSLSVGYAFFLSQSSQIFVENNIFENNSAGGLSPLVVISQAIGNVTLDHNTYVRLNNGTTNEFFYNGSVVVGGLAGWQTATGQDANSNSTTPLFSGTVGTGGTCYVSGIPAGPQPCPTPYTLNTGASNGANIAATLTSMGFATLVRDYYAHTVPNGTGTGWNIGAYGANP